MHQWTLFSPRQGVDQLTMNGLLVGRDMIKRSLSDEALRESTTTVEAMSLGEHKLACIGN